MSSEYTRIYRNINTDITIGNYTHRDLAIPTSAFAVTKVFQFGMLSTIIALCIAFYLMIVIKEINETKIKGYYKALIWWTGLVRGDYKTFPKSYEREFI